MKWMATLPWWASVIACSLFFSDPQFFSALDFDILDHRIIHSLFFFLIEPCVSLIAGLICMLLLAALALVIASSKLVCCLYIVGGLNLMAWKVKAISKSSEHFIIWFIQATTAEKHEKEKACWRGLPLTNGLNLLYWFASLSKSEPCSRTTSNETYQVLLTNASIIEPDDYEQQQRTKLSYWRT